MKTLYTLLLVVLSYTVHSQSDRVWLVDTLEKYESYLDRLEESEDCSVRALAEAFNLNYMEAHTYLAKWGRVRGRGMYLSKFVSGLRKDFRSAIRDNSIIEPKIPQQFVRDIAQDGYVYLVSTFDHMFVIEQNRRGRWIVKGNYDDKKSKIRMYIKLNIKEWKK